jgi:hypothetical protein
MAATPEWLDAWVDEHGPYLYHATQIANISSILDEGLHPWDQGPGAIQANSIWQPRPGHVYLATESAIKRYDCDNPDRRLRIDIRELQAENFNPDEDLIFVPSLKNSLLWKNDKTVQNLNGDKHSSYGEWAERCDFGANPEYTRLSLEECGTLSHRGLIPPNVIASAMLATC